MSPQDPEIQNHEHKAGWSVSVKPGGVGVEAGDVALDDGGDSKHEVLVDKLLEQQSC